MATRVIKAIIEAKDQTSPVLSRISGAVSALGAVAVAVGVGALARQFVGGLVAVTKAAGVQEAALSKMAQALRLTGQDVGTVLPKLKAHAAAIQDMTGADDDAILSAQSLLVSMGKLSGEGLQRATRAALDLSSATGQDLNSAFMLVAKAAAGNTSQLARYGIVLDKGIPQTQKFGAALAKIEELFGGQAAERLKTFEGRVGEVTSRFGDLQEAIGGPLREVMTEFLGSVLSPYIKDLTGAIESSEGFRRAIFNIAIAMASLGSAVEPVLGPLFRFLAFAGKLAAENIIRSIEMQKSALKLFGLEASETEGRFAALVSRLKELRDAGPQVSSSGGAAQAAELMHAIGLPAAEDVKALEESITVVAQEIYTQLDAINELGLIGAKALELRIAATGAAIESLGQNLRRTLRQFGVNAAMAFGDALVEAADSGTHAFRDFFQSLLKDLARAIIQALVLQAILSAVGMVSGGRVGGGRGGGGGTFGGGFGYAGAYAAGGIVLGGMQLGRDSVPVIAQPGEAFLSRDLTDKILSMADGGGMANIRVEMGPNLAALADKLTVEVRRGGARLEATALAGNRATR